MTTRHDSGRSAPTRKFTGQKWISIRMNAQVPTYEGDTPSDGAANAHQSVVDALTSAKIIDKHAPETAPLVVDPKSIKIE